MLLLYRGEEFDPNFYYRSGLDIDHSFLLSGRAQTLLVPKLNESIARARFEGEVVAYTDPFSELSKRIRGKTVLADFSSLNMRLAGRLKKMCRLKDHSMELLQERAVKKPGEVAQIRKAARLTRKIFDSLDFARARTELDLEKQIRVQAAQMGLEHAFDPIVATGSSTAYPHYRAGRKRLGSLVLIDYAVRCGHYCADLTRCFILDGDRKKKQEYEALRNICHTIADELPGLRTGAEVAALSEKLVERAGLPKMIHSIGHGVGLDIHELPRLGPSSKDSLKGAVLAIEPAFYRKYGMRFEETIYFDGKKARIL